MTPISLQATTTTIILLLSLLLFTPTTTRADTVLDNDGDPVKGGAYYEGYSLAFTEMGPYVGGGITMFNNGSLSCPSFIVAQSNISAPDLGIQIKFTPQISTEENIVYTESNLTIAFRYLEPEPMCRRKYTTVWTESANMVVLNGEEGSNASWFKLEKVDYLSVSVYSILYGDKEVLYDRQPNGEILLSLEKGYPFLVFFFSVGGISSTTPSDSLEMLNLPSTRGLLR